MEDEVERRGNGRDRRCVTECDLGVALVCVQRVSRGGVFLQGERLARRPQPRLHHGPPASSTQEVPRTPSPPSLLSAFASWLRALACPSLALRKRGAGTGGF
eukprot:3170937-Rhodomonas_salina.1